MFSKQNILAIAHYELKTLWRSWFFRIFSGLAATLLVFMNIGVLVYQEAPWFFRAMPSGIPYYTTQFLNIIQAIVAIFLASDFFKRDKKLDTTEVIYMRSMSNGDYVLGKTLGIFVVFMLLNLFIMCISLLINLFAPHVGVDLAAYLIYPMLISVPTLLFIFGLAFLLMTLLKNQALTFILLLGYVACDMFFFYKYYNALFDYMGMYVPMFRSDFVGITNLGMVLVQRGIYLCLGLGFIGLATRFLKRLPQSALLSKIILVFSILMLGTGGYLATVHLGHTTGLTAQRQTMLSLNNSYAEYPAASIKSCHISADHQGNSISCRSDMVLENTSGKPMDLLVLNLNNGLTIDQLSINGSKTEFERKEHLVIVNLPQTMAVGGTLPISVAYSGIPSQAGVYLGTDSLEHQQPFMFFMYRVDKCYSFVTDNYVLLTKENMWYPSTGISYSDSTMGFKRADFIDFKLRVKTKPGLVALSQGAVTQKGEGEFEFAPEQALPQISLNIGHYETKSVEAGGVTYQLSYLKGHDYFSRVLDQLSDTVPQLISELKEDFERSTELQYPFKRFSIVEVPAQFYAQVYLHTQALEWQQPEMSYFPEKGYYWFQADVGGRMDREQKRNKERGEDKSDKELQAEVFTDFVKSTFLNNEGTFFYPDEVLKGRKPQYIYPQYYAFAYGIANQEYPVLNAALESYLDPMSFATVVGMGSWFGGMTFEGNANLLLGEHSFADLLKSAENKDKLERVIGLKGVYFFKFLQHKAGSEGFEQKLSAFLKENRFKEAKLSDFESSVITGADYDPKAFMQDWMYGEQLPGYRFSDMKAYSVLDGEYTRTQVRLTVTNTEPVDGVIVVGFVVRGQRRRGFRGPGGGSNITTPSIEHVYEIPANSTREIGILLDEEPRLMALNTLVSKNLPVKSNINFPKYELDKDAVPFDTIRELPYKKDIVQPGEIVVDNEDEGFKILTGNGNQNPLKKLLNIEGEKKDKYQWVNTRWAPDTWTGVIEGNFYGDHVNSAYIIRKGDGSQKVQWKTALETSGKYDIYYHMNKMRGRRRGGPPGPPSANGGNGGGNRGDDAVYHFTVHHDDGAEEVPLEMNDCETGWNHLGEFYLSPDSAKVELSNLTDDGRAIFADAVKWVKK